MSPPVSRCRIARYASATAGTVARQSSRSSRPRRETSSRARVLPPAE